jgi:hypothetical protein
MQGEDFLAVLMVKSKGRLKMSDQTNFITCPNCGATMSVAKRNKSGRKPLNIDVKIICDTLCSCRDISLAAQKLGCSRGYLYQELKKQGTTPKEIIQK